MGYIFVYALIPLLFFGGVIGLIVWLARRKNKPSQSAFDWRRFGVGAAMSIIVPYFISFTTSAVFNQLASTASFISMITMAIVVLIIGLVIAHNTVISAGLTIGSIIEIIVAFVYNSDSVSPSVVAILAGFGLAVLIYFAYRKMQEQEVK